MEIVTKVTTERILDIARSKYARDPITAIVYERIANLWIVYLAREGLDRLIPEDVAAMLMLAEIGQIAVDGSNVDNWVKLAGHAGCGAEAAELDMTISIGGDTSGKA
jgi:hypothetical protein